MVALNMNEYDVDGGDAWSYIDESDPAGELSW